MSARPNSPYLRDNRADLIAKTALIDQLRARVGGADARLEHAPARLERRRAAALVGLRQPQAVRHRAWRIPDVRRRPRRRHGSVRLGRDGQIDMIAPSMQLIRSPEHKHTDQDIPEFVPAVGLEAVGRAFAKIIDEVNKLDRKDILAPAGTSSTQAQ